MKERYSVQGEPILADIEKMRMLLDSISHMMQDGNWIDRHALANLNTAKENIFLAHKLITDGRD